MCSIHAGGGTGGTNQPPPPQPTFWKQIQKYTFSNKKEIFILIEYEHSTGGPRRSIQIYDWSVSILYHMVSLKTTIYTKLHLVGDFCVFTMQVM